jgi:hypothetical protein
LKNSTGHGGHLGNMNYDATMQSLATLSTHAEGITLLLIAGFDRIYEGTIRSNTAR